jgi:hypothetical protein
MPLIILKILNYYYKLKYFRLLNIIVYNNISYDIQRLNIRILLLT